MASTKTSRLRPVIDEVVIYQSIFLTEHSIMRANAVELETIPKRSTESHRGISSTSRRRGVLYLIPRRGIHVPSASRALDPLILVYAAVKGYLWKRCGFDYFIRTSSVCTEASTSQDTELDTLFQRIEEIVDEMVRAGYLFVLPYTAVSEDTVNPAVFAEICTIPRHEEGSMRETGLLEFITRAEYEYIKNSFSAELARVLGAETADNVWRKLAETARRINNKYGSYVGYNLDENYCVYFKTLHGELGRLVENARSLPKVIAISSVNVLPVLIDPPTVPLEEYGVKIEELTKLIKEYLLRNKVESNEASIVSEVIVESLKMENVKFLTPYQFEVLKQYFKHRGKGRTNVLLVLTSPTGTGKTLVFAIIALTLTLLWKLHGETERKVVIVYPRRSLERQQLERLLKLISYINDDQRVKQALGKNPIRVLIRDMESLSRKDIDRLKGPDVVRGISLGNRVIKHEVLKGSLNGRDICLYKSEPSYVFDVKENCYLHEEFTRQGRLVRAVEKADIVITNHSMLFKMAIDSYVKSYYKALFENTGLLVLDEAHVFFDPSYTHILQTISLFYAIYKQGVDVIFSSATISEEHLIPENLVTNNILGIVRKQMVDKTIIENRVKAILPLISQNSEVIVVDYFETTYKELMESGKKKYKGPMKLTFWYVANPYPFKRASTSLEEIIVSIAHLVNGVRRRSQELSNSTSVIYVEYKSTLKDIVGYLTNVILIKAVDHADRVLLSKFGRDVVRSIVGLNVQPRVEGVELISKVIEERLKKTGNLLRVIWDLDIYPHVYLTRFHALTPYIDHSAVQVLSSTSTGQPFDYEKELKRVVGTEVIERLIADSNRMLANTVWESDDRMHDFAKQLTSEVCTNQNNPVPYFIVHHGDFHESRKYLDSLLMSKGCHKPLFVVATSTLELGIDVPSVLTVVQYGVTAPPSSLMQRVGRSGRESSTRFISTGILVLRNDGRDNFFVDDYHVTRYIYNSERVVIPEIIKDSVMLVRIASTIQRRAKKGEDLGMRFLKRLEQICNLDSVSRSTEIYMFAMRGMQ